jgi:hypothetical protein
MKTTSTKPLTVWGTDIFHAGRQCRAIVASSTKKAAAEALGLSIREFNTWAESTGNADELDLAMSTPGVAWIHLADTSAPFHRGTWVRGVS